MAESNLPAAGWYPDPADPTGRRYWDGQRWTEHIAVSAWQRPDEPAPPTAAGPGQPAAQPAEEPGSGAPAEEPGGAADAAGPAPAAEDLPGAGAAPADEPPEGEPTERVGGSAGQGFSAPDLAAAGVGAPGPAAPGVVPASPGGPGTADPLGAAPPPPPTTGWGVPQPMPGAYPGHEAYAPQIAPLTPSGMRRVSALFSDMGRILKRAWWQIALISLAIWAAWTLVAAAASAILIDFGRLTQALNFATQTLDQYQNRTIPRDVREEMADAFEAVPRTSSAWAWIAVGVVIMLLYGFAACLQVVAVNRLGMDAAAGHDVRLGAAARTGVVGGIRLFGYYVLLTLAMLAATLLLGLLIVATSNVPALLVLLMLFVIAGATVLAFFLVGRLAPITAQVAVDRGALGWTWRATRTRFWGVLGRYLLWALVAGVIGQVVLSILTIPLFLAASASLASAPLAITPTILITWLVTMVLSLVIGAVTYVGIVPIWRDLTDDPRYRSIADGQPLPDPV